MHYEFCILHLRALARTNVNHGCIVNVGRHNAAVNVGFSVEAIGCRRLYE